MIVNQIYLLKTPLDSNYNNIIDFNSTNSYEDMKKIYRDVLIDSYGDYYEGFPYILLDNFNRSIKINNKTSNITLPYNYREIREYNYLIIKSGSEYYFFFILSLISENDGGNSSCTISIKWDVWANNLDNIYESEIGSVYNKLNDYNLIEQKHFNRFTENKQPIYYNNSFNRLPIK